MDLKKIAVSAVVLGSFVYSAMGLNYPNTKKVDQVDDYFGVEVSDPYRWLEDDVRESQEVSNWVEAENSVTEKYLSALPIRGTFADRMEKLFSIDRYGVPGRQGKYYIQSIRHSGANHSIVYKMKELGGEKEVLFNPNTWSEDGTVALSSTVYSQDGKYVAYAIQESGSDWKTWKVRNVETGKDLSDKLEYLKFTTAAWVKDNSGFYYGKYPDPVESEKYMSLNVNMSLMYHKLGTAQAEDIEVLYDADNPELCYSPEVTQDGKYLLVTIYKGGDDEYKVLCKDLTKPESEFKDIVPEYKYGYGLIGNDDNIFYFTTDRDAPNNRIVAIDINKPLTANSTDLISEAKENLDGVTFTGDKFLCKYIKDVKTVVKVYSTKGKFLYDVKLPGPGAAYGFGCKQGENETFYTYQSYTTPASIYRYDIKAKKSTLINTVDLDINPKDYVNKQVFYKSKDGTKVPMYICYKKGTKLDGSAPTIMYGYGGFNISLLPRFSTTCFAWMEQGGVYVTVNLRGGGEYGKDWHEAGKKQNKQNVFDDFITAGEYLVKHKYTSPQHLGIMGGSNGGLLVGACMTQRPDLFGAAVPEVGVMDMLRYDNFTAGRFWVDEYGSSKDSKEMFEYLLNYSPYHNIKVGVDYPATLVTTGDTDDRVVPGHSFKFAARLQGLYKGDKPQLIRIQTKAGHGSGKPISIYIEEISDILGFFYENLK